MTKLLTFVMLLFLPFAAYTQKPLDCKSKAAQDSLVQIFSKAAYELGSNDPQREAIWDSLLSICPNIAEAYQEKSVPYLRNGDYATGFLLVNKAVELDPERWTAYRGYLHCIYSKNYEKALSDFTDAERLSPNQNVMDHTYSFFCGIAYLETGEYDKAEQAFLKDIKQQRRRVATNDIHFNTLLYLGIVYLEMQEFDQAEKQFKDCLQNYEQLPEANYYLAVTLKRLGHADAGLYFQKAKQYLKEGYKINELAEPFVNFPRQIDPGALE